MATLSNRGPEIRYLGEGMEDIGLWQMSWRTGEGFWSLRYPLVTETKTHRPLVHFVARGLLAMKLDSDYS